MFVAGNPRFGVVAKSYWSIAPTNGMLNEQTENYGNIKTPGLTRRRAERIATITIGVVRDIGHFDGVVGWGMVLFRTMDSSLVIWPW